MATEGIDIVIRQSGAKEAAQSLQDLGNAADKAATGTDALHEEMSRSRGAATQMSADLQRLGNVANSTTDFAEGLASGMREVIEQELKLGSITAEQAEELKKYAGAMALGGEAADRSGKAHQAGVGGMFAWKKEASRTREAAQFLTSSLGQLVPASGAAGAGLRLLATAALGGGGVVLALEGIHAAASLLKGAYDDWVKETLEANRATREHAETLRVAQQRTSDFLADLRETPASVKVYRDALRELDGEIRKHKEEIEKITEESSVWDNYDKRAAKVSAAWEKIVELQAQARQDAAIRAASVEEAGRRDSGKRGDKLVAQANEENRVARGQTLALVQKYAADEVRIHGEAERQIADLRVNTGLRSATETAAREVAIRRNAAEEIRRIEEARAQRMFGAAQGPQGIGATSERSAQLEAETKLYGLGVQYDQARRAGNAAQMAEIRKQMALESEAAYLKMSLLDAEIRKQQAANDAAYEQQRLDETEKQSMERGERFKTGSQLRLGGGNVDTANQLKELEDRLSALRIQLDETEQENPQLAGQVALARARLDRDAKMSTARTALGSGADEMFAGTREGIDHQLEALGDMYGKIDELRQADLISEQTAEQMKAKVASDQDAIRLTNTRTFYGTLAGLQHSSVREIAAIGKAAAVAQATIDGIAAVQKALASAPPPANFILAGAVGAVAAVNVAEIISQNVGFETGGFTGYGPRDRAAGVVHGQEYVFDAAATARIGVPALEAMRRGDEASHYVGATALPSSSAGKVVVNNYGAPENVSVRRRDDGSLEVTIREIARKEAKDAVYAHAPSAVARDIQSGPNSRTRSALRKTTKTEDQR